MSTAEKTTPKISLSPTVEEEIRRIEESIRLLRSGSLDPNEFKKFRLNNGVYGIRNKPTQHMIRIKCPYGALSADQLDAIADVTDRYTSNRMAHVTTRQAIQIHYVELTDVPAVLRRLNESGLTTREACGNTVRNVTASPLAGLLAGEIFDVTPYADAIFRHFLRNPLTQNFPRKFKIAFYGGAMEDLAYTAINDLGFVAAKRTANGREELGFRVYVGGGLGATPAAAILLEEFTPLEEFFPTADAVVRLFDRYGDRKDKFHARLKFVVRRFGPDEFRKMVKEERVAVRATRAGGWAWALPPASTPVPPVLTEAIRSDQAPDGEFETWRRTNVLAQKQKGYSLAFVVLKLGDITVERMRSLAAISRRFNGGRLRTMAQQNMVLPWIRDEHLVALHLELKKAGLAVGGALRLSDVTRCPGADTCQIAVTKSRGLAEAIDGLFENGLASETDMKGLQIKISGCTNSCGQHHIGNIGFFGTYRKIDGHEVPHYQLLIGGDTKPGVARFGQPVAAVPARRAPEVVKHLVELYKRERQSEESFVDTMDRLGKDRLRKEVEPFRSLPPYAENKELYFEWGENKEFHSEIGQGECAA